MTEPIIRIKLDRAHTVDIADDAWTLTRRTNGKTRLLKEWRGGRRTLLRELQNFGIQPTSEANEMLEALPEYDAFREDPPAKEAIR